MVYLIHERLSSATACSPRPTCHVRYRRRIMWIFHFVQFACTECSGVERERSPPGATRDPGAPTTSKRGSTATGGFTMTAPRMFSTYSGSSATSFVAHGVGVGEATCCHRYFDAARESAAGAALGAPARPPLPLLPRPLPFPRPRPRPTPAAAAGSCCGAYGIPTTAVVVKVPVAQSPPCCILLQPYSCYVAVGASLNSRHSQHGP